MAAGLDSSVSLLGQISSATILLAALITLLIGTLVRRYGYRRLYVAGTLAMALGSTIMAVAPNVAVVLVAALLLSFATATVLPVALAIAATELSPTARRRVMSYQIACIFAAVAVGLPACVFLAQALSWRGTFAVLAAVAVLLLPAVFGLVPVGSHDPSARFHLPTAVQSYRELLRDRSLASMFGFQILYVVVVFGTGAYLSALIIARGFGADAVGAALAVVGVAFILSSVLSAEVLGKLRVDLRLVVLGAALSFCVSRAVIYILPLPLPVLVGLLAAGSLVDGVMAVAFRTLVASYDVKDRALSMVFFAACDNVGQAVGGVVAGALLAAGGYAAIGLLVLAISLLGSWLPLASRALRRAEVASE